MENLLAYRLDSDRDYRKAKIVATIGPATKSAEMLKKLILAGANVFRLNFSHGSHEEHLKTLNTIREVSKELDMPVAVLQDLSGPKLRITNLEAEMGSIPDGGQIKIFQGSKETTAENIYTELVDPTKILKPGNAVLLADGIIVLDVESVESDHVVCKISKGGKLRSRVGIAFPDSNLDLPATTEKDMTDLKWGIEHKVDYVAVSFVQNAKDIQMVKSAIKEQGGIARVIPKIERKSALANIEEILDVSDGLMVARGDLGLEVPLEQLPRIQERLIEEANFRGIPVIVATQMLHSMVTSLRPTRAEVSDIAAAVSSGADAVMLSEETAIGEHPVEAVEYIGKIAWQAEKSFEFDEYKLRLRGADTSTVPDAVAYAAAAAANKVKASCVIACTEMGTTARLIAKYRPQQPLYGASSNEQTLRRMCLMWGVRPIRFEAPASRDQELETAIQAVKEKGEYKDGDLAVTTGGLSVRSPGSTTIMEIKSM